MQPRGPSLGAPNGFVLFRSSCELHRLLVVGAKHFSEGGVIVSSQMDIPGLNSGLTQSGAMRSRVLAIILMVVIASVFWIDSRYPALLKRMQSGTHVQAAGALTFGVVYPVERDMPLATRIWRTTVNWLDANRVGMTFSFLFGPAALTLSLIHI